eukprot:1391877-Amorphochlora_amoeboformis.AAC.1
MSSDQLATTLEARGLDVCKSIQCCSRSSTPLKALWSPAPATEAQIRAGLDKDLVSFREEKGMVDNMEVLLARRRRQLNVLRDSLTMWRV